MRKTVAIVVFGAFLALGNVASAKAKPAPAKPAPAPAPAAEEKPVGAVVGGVVADEPSDEEKEVARQQAEFESKLSFKTGTVDLLGGKVQLVLPEGYRYLDAADTEKVLVEWGNPPGQKSVGMVVPKGSGLWEAESLAIVVDYVDDGHVSDADAAKIDYDKLLGQMRDDTRKENVERKKAGIDTLELVGWAEPPHYDKATRKLYWARELSASSALQHTLNYEVRVLGREGVLGLTAIAGMSVLPQAKEEMQRMLTIADFTGGNRYTDYKKSTDRTATYGIAAVVAGGVAAKVLGTKGFLALLLGAKKLIVLLFVGIAAGVRKFWGRLTGRREEPKPESDPAA